MGGLRTPFFIVATVAMGLVVLVELGGPLMLGGGDASAALLAQADALGAEMTVGGGAVQEPSGRGIPYLALIDGIALFTVLMMGLGMVVPHRLHGRMQGVVTLVGSIVLILLALVLLIVAIVELLIMVSLFFAPPFGTLAYLALWGFFPRGDAALLLGLIMFLKLVFVVTLVLAHQRFLQNKGLVLLMLTSVVATVVVTFLHGLGPVIVVSILDDVAAIIVAVLAIIWGIVLLIGSIPAVVKAARVTAQAARTALP
jgi:hypothetical protein